jgi:hypothetical protein
MAERETKDSRPGAQGSRAAMASWSRGRRCLQLADIGGEIAVIGGWGRDPKAEWAGTLAWVRALAWVRSGTPPPVVL